MNNRTEAQILADTFESVRGLSKFFLSKVKPKDLYTNLTIDGVKFNSPYWITAHLAWSENFLLLKGLGGKVSEAEWLEEYGFGSDPGEIKTKPPYEEVMNTFDSIHREAINYLRSLTDEQLDEENNIGANFGGKNTKRMVIIHAIRHEPMHSGQLTWFLKTKGSELV